MKNVSKLEILNWFLVYPLDGFGVPSKSLLMKLTGIPVRDLKPRNLKEKSGAGILDLKSVRICETGGFQLKLLLVKGFLCLANGRGNSWGYRCVVVRSWLLVGSEGCSDRLCQVVSLLLLLLWPIRLLAGKDSCRVGDGQDGQGGDRVTEHAGRYSRAYKSR